jgi:hypothetical protein
MVESVCMSLKYICLPCIHCTCMAGTGRQISPAGQKIIIQKHRYHRLLQSSICTKLDVYTTFFLLSNTTIHRHTREPNASTPAPNPCVAYLPAPQLPSPPSILASQLSTRLKRGVQCSEHSVLATLCLRATCYVSGVAAKKLPALC